MSYNLGGNSIPRGMKQGSIQNFSPEQMQLFQSLFSNLTPDSFLGKLSQGDQSTFDQLERPALKQFSEIQGNLASRFSGMGSGARHSSGFQNASNQASSDFASQLQSERLGIQNKALQDLMSFSQMLMGQKPQDQFLYEDKKSNFWNNLGSLIGGGLSSSFGGDLASIFSNIFKGK